MHRTPDRALTIPNFDRQHGGQERAAKETAAVGGERGWREWQRAESISPENHKSRQAGRAAVYVNMPHSLFLLIASDVLRLHQQLLFSLDLTSLLLPFGKMYIGYTDVQSLSMVAFEHQRQVRLLPVANFLQHSSPGLVAVKLSKHLDLLVSVKLSCAFGLDRAPCYLHLSVICVLR